MKTHLLKLLLPVLLISLSSCFSNKCGDNVSQGDFDLLPSSIVSWFPYQEVTQLTFVNEQGTEITLTRTETLDRMIYNSLGQFCNEGFADSAENYFNGRWIQVKYTFRKEGINYSVESAIFVNSASMGTQPKLYDNAVFASAVFLDGGVDAIGGYIDLLASARGNTFTSGEINDFSSFQVFAPQLEVNGKILENVIYFKRLDVPALIVKEGIGVVGFLGQNNTMWLLKE
jgi:hypothetical protein